MRILLIRETGKRNGGCTTPYFYCDDFYQTNPTASRFKKLGSYDMTYVTKGYGYINQVQPCILRPVTLSNKLS